MATAAVLAAAQLGQAQQNDQPGIELTFDVGTRISVDDNAGLNDPSLGTTSRVDTRLGFGLRSETRSELLTFGVSTALRFDNPPNESASTEFTTPVISGSYARFNSTSRLEFSGRFSREDLEDSTITLLDANFNPVDLTISSGALQNTSARLSFATGIGEPLGFDLSASFVARDYIDTVDPDLYDRTSVSFSAGSTLVFSDVLTGRLGLTSSWFNADDLPETERTSNRLSFSAQYLASEVLSFGAGVSYTATETTEFGVVSEDKSGVGLSFSATRALPDGAIRAGFSQELTSASDRTLISVERQMELPRGDLSFGIGYSIAEEGDNRFVANARAVREFATGSLSATLSQETRANDDDEDILLTRFELDYRQEINANESFSVGLGLGRSEEIGGLSGDETTRGDVNVTYRRALTRDWDWAVGYLGRYSDDGGSAFSNSIFTTFDRSFSIRP